MGITLLCGDDDDNDAGSGFNSTICLIATATLVSNTDCITAVSDPNNIDASMACSSTCRPLFQAVVDACAMETRYVMLHVYRHILYFHGTVAWPHQG